MPAIRPRPRTVFAVVVAVGVIVFAEPSAAAPPVPAPLSPTITSVDHTTFTAGTAGSFTVTTFTAGPTPLISETGSLPTGLSFTDNGDGTATLSGTPAAGTGGNHPLTMAATNGFAPDAAQAFTLSVLEAPYIDSSNHATFTAGSAGSYTVTTVAGFPSTTFFYEVGALPSGVSFTDNGNGTATISGTPAAGTGGFWTFSITATNGVGPGYLQSFTLAILDAPRITSADHTTFKVGFPGSYTITTGSLPTSALSETGALPSGVTFVDNHAGTATLSGTPATGTGGTYPLSIKASNGIAPDATQSFTVTVNEPPAITSSNHATFTVGSAGAFTVTTTPGMPATTTLTKFGVLPTGVTFTDNGDGTATIAGTPAAGTGGSWPLQIDADNGQTRLQLFTLTVNDGPAITSAPSTTFTVGVPGTFTVVCTGTPLPGLSAAAPPPPGISFIDNANGTATVSGTPAAGLIGSFPVTILCSNGVGLAIQLFSLNVQANPPAITSANATTFTAGTPGSFTVTTTPGVPTTTALSLTGVLPSGLTFTDNADGTGTLSGTTAGAGLYPLTVVAGNPGPASVALQSFTLTVVSLPVLTAPSSRRAPIGLPLNVGVSATGFPIPALSATSPLPAGLTFVDNGNGTGSLTGSPVVGTSGDFPITLHAANTVGTADKVLTLQIGIPIASVPVVSPSATSSAAASPSPSPSPSPAPAPTGTGAPVRPRLHLVSMTPNIPAGSTAVLVASGGGQRAVELLCYVRPASTYRLMRTATPALDAVTFALRPLGNMRCYARYAGENGDASPSVIVTVHTALSLAARRTGALTYLFTGRAVPGVRQLVTIVRLDGRGRALPTSTVTTRPDGTFAVSRTFLGGGSFDFVARSQTPYNAPGVSPTLPLTLH